MNETYRNVSSYFEEQNANDWNMLRPVQGELQLPTEDSEKSQGLNFRCPPATPVYSVFDLKSGPINGLPNPGIVARYRDFKLHVLHSQELLEIG